ncbi:hypothetical protein SS37A_32980 [Methylocystis iwaonis]|uniref:Uncharacterized protein n=1 Tax=Methylocystis iwaonis TaxID=2885079 RepID=A0ABM8ECL4_9HYPH|nr:hypothetical protein SS37A_32980 [Methylocystis iwaonis]
MAAPRFDGTQDPENFWGADFGNRARPNIGLGEAQQPFDLGERPVGIFLAALLVSSASPRPV